MANHFQNIVIALLKEGPYVGRGWSPPRGSFETEDNPMWALANVLSPTPGNPRAYNDLRYIVSHDEYRVAWEVDNDGSPEARIIGGIQKAKLGAATLFTATGIPMFYMGEEVGMDNAIPGRPEENKIDWSRADPGTRAYYRGMIDLRLHHPTLAGDGIAFHCPDWQTDRGPCQQDKTICYWRFPGEEESAADIVIASNYDHAEHLFTIQFPESGIWHRFDPETGTTPVEVINGALELTLEASTTYIFLKELPAF